VLAFMPPRARLRDDKRLRIKATLQFKQVSKGMQAFHILDISAQTRLPTSKMFRVAPDAGLPEFPQSRGGFQGSNTSDKTKLLISSNIPLSKGQYPYQRRRFLLQPLHHFLRSSLQRRRTRPPQRSTMRIEGLPIENEY
jgi:hypothetical protein